jgi:hypothetical protein
VFYSSKASLAFLDIEGSSQDLQLFVVFNNLGASSTLGFAQKKKFKGLKCP